MIVPISKAYFPVLTVAIVLFSGCAQQQQVKMPKESMTLKDLQEGAQEAIAANRSLLATQYLTRIVEQHGDDFQTPEYRLQLADLHFTYGKENYAEEAFKLAYECYRKFYKLNPSDQRAEYASYRAILSRFYQTTRYECDSAIVEKTIRSCSKHLADNRFTNGQYVQEVRDILYTCRRHMVDKELYIFSTYLRDGKLQSARNRLSYVRDHYLEVVPDLEARLLYLECKLAAEEKDFDTVAKSAERLVKEFADSEYTAMAKNFVSHQKQVRNKISFDWI